MPQGHDQVAAITRASWSRAMSAEQWTGFLAAYLRGRVGQVYPPIDPSFSIAICDILLRLITATSPPSNRLLSYYQAALHSLASFGHNRQPLVDPSNAAIRILEWHTSLDTSQDELCKSHLVVDKAARLETLNLLAKPLVRMAPSIETHDPAECLGRLNYLLDLFNACRPTSDYAHPSSNIPALRLAQILLESLSPCILSINRRAFLQHPHLLTPLSEKLASRVSEPDHTHQDSSADVTYFPSIFRHLFPSLCKRLVYASSSPKLDQPDPSDFNRPVSSTTASAIIAHTLLTPGASAMQFDSDGQQVPTPLIIRIIGLALSQIEQRSEDPSVNVSLPTHCRTWLFDLMLAAIRMGNISSSVVLDWVEQSETQLADESNTEDDKASWKALLGGGRLAELVRLAISVAPDIAPQEVLLNSCDIALLRQNIVGRDTPNSTPDVNPAEVDRPRRFLHRVQLWSAFLSSLHANQLVAPQIVDATGTTSFMPDADMKPRDHDYSELELGLDDLCEILNKTKETSIAELASAAKQALLTAAWAFDLTALTSLTKALTGLNTLCTLFLWLEPKDLLKPVKDVLDGWETARSQSKKPGTMDESDGSSGFEKFGALVGWVQGVAGRFGLMSHLPIHLGSSTGFTVHYLLNPSSAYPLASLPPSHQTTLASWIEALYGSSGISDDLLTNTDPRIFFTISTSIFKQSFDALRTGLLDLETFREGLSYFEQELFSTGCAVGVVGWLVNELSRVGPVSDTSYPTALLDILQAIILSDSITPTAISLIAAKSLRLLRCFSSLFGTAKVIMKENPAALERLNRLPPDLPRAIQLDIVRLEEKLTELPSNQLVTPTGFLSFNFFDIDLLSYGLYMGWEEALNFGLKMAINDEVLDLYNHPYHRNHPNKPLPAIAGKTNSIIALWSLLPYVLKSVSIAKFVRVVLAGICGCMRTEKVAGVATEEVEAAHVAAVADEKLVIKLEKMWDVERHERTERAVKLAVDIFTWPFEQVGAHLVDPLIRSSVPSPPTESDFDMNDKSSVEYHRRPKLVGPVLEEVLVEWGARIGAYEVLEDAELERDVIIGCLNRLTILERASIRGGNQALGPVSEDWPNFYRRLALDALKQEMTIMNRRTVKSKTKLRGIRMLQWIFDGLVVEDGRLIGTLL